MSLGYFIAPFLKNEKQILPLEEVRFLNRCLPIELAKKALIGCHMSECHSLFQRIVATLQQKSTEIVFLIMMKIWVSSRKQIGLFEENNNRFSFFKVVETARANRAQKIQKKPESAKKPTNRKKHKKTNKTKDIQKPKKHKKAKKNAKNQKTE